MNQSSRSLWLWILVTLLATVGSFWQAPFPSELRMQHVPTVIGLFALGITVRRNWLGHRSVICLLLFLWLHILGARWIYSYVPYDRWAEWLTGQSLSARMGW